MESVFGRRETGLGAKAERWVSCYSSRSWCAMSKSRSQRAAGTRAKRSAESEVGECPVVDVTVDVERLRRWSRRHVVGAGSGGVMTSSCSPRAECRRDQGDTSLDIEELRYMAAYASDIHYIRRSHRQVDSTPRSPLAVPTYLSHLVQPAMTRPP